jgi:hypothetical protein
MKFVLLKFRVSLQTVRHLVMTKDMVYNSVRLFVSYSAIIMLVSSTNRVGRVAERILGSRFMLLFN